MAATTLARRAPPDYAVGLSEQFLRHSSVNAQSGCIEWHGNKVAGGYGRMTFKGKSTLAHRAAYIQCVGEPGDKWVLHRCDNPCCINPKHLFVGYPKDNSADRNAKGRDAHGERNGLAKLTGEKVAAIRRDNRSDETLAKIFGVSPACIWSVKTRRTWRHLP